MTDIKAGGVVVEMSTELRDAIDGVIARITAADAEIKTLKEETLPDGEKTQALTKQIEEQAGRLEELTSIFKKPNFSVPGTEPTGDHKKDFSFARALWAIRTNDWAGAGVEREIFQETQKRAEKIPHYVQKDQEFATTTLGGFIVPDEQAESVIDRLRENTVAFKLGATEIGGLDRAPVTFPRLTTSVTAAWGAEAATIAAFDAVLDQVSLTPSELKSLNVYSNTLLKISHPRIDAVIRDDMSLQLAAGLDLDVMTGGGTPAPVGIANQTNVLTAAVGAAPTYDALQQFPAALRVNNSFTGKLGWAMSPETFNAPSRR